MPFPPVTLELLRAVDAGLEGVAVLSPAGEPIEVVGALDRHEVRALAALVSRQGPAGVLDRLFAGELVSATLDRTEFPHDLVTTAVERGGRGDSASLEQVPPTLGVEPGTHACGPDRTVYLGVAGRCVFVVAIAGPDATAAAQAMERLCLEIDVIVHAARGASPDGWRPPSSSGGSGSPPADAFAWPPRPRDVGGKS